MRTKVFLVLYISILCLTFFSSCSKDWFEEKPDQRLTVPETLSDFQGLLDNVGFMSQQYPAISEIASDLHFVDDAVFESSTRDYLSDAYIWSHRVRHQDVSDWNQTYYKVLVDNIVLDGLQKVSPTNQSEAEEWKNIKGQALMNRARAFYELSQVYTLPYNAQDASKSLGIVLRLTSDITEPSKRSSVKETFDQIIKDTNEAIQLLPDRPAALTRYSKASAYALLSRIYLIMADYNESLKHANNALQINSSIVDFNSLNKNRNFIGRYNAEVLLHSNYVAALITTNCLISPDVVNLYNEHDLRKVLFFRDNFNNTFSFKGNYDSRSTNLFNGFTTTEMFLTRAECNARLGNVVSAMADLNKLFKNRWDNSVPYTELLASNPEEALIMVLTERKKELFLRGLRWMDLRRLNKDPRFAVTLTRSVSGVTYTLEPNSLKYAFPIPDDVIEQAGIEQNPAWE